MLNNGIILLFVFMTALLGCHKNNEELPSDPKPIFTVSNEPYWCRYDYIRLTFSVSYWDTGSLTYKYMYEDTLRYIKDTLAVPAYNWYYKKYGFSKQSSRFDFLLSMALPQSHIYISGVSFPIFDLTKIKGLRKLAPLISWDGNPFIKNSPYTIGYYGGYSNAFATAIGQYDSIVETVVNYKRDYPFSNGYEQINRTLYFAKNNIGLVKYNFEYECKNLSGVRDTSYKLEYKIKSILD
jgi:hypothetical protein